MRVLGLMALTLGVACLQACRRPEPVREPVMDLVDAFAATDDAPPTAVLRANDRLARDHFLDGWSAPDADGIAWTSAPRAEVAFDAGHEPVDGTLRIVGVGGPTAQRFRFVFVRLNGRPLGRLRVDPGEQELRLAVHANDQISGRNVLDLFAPGGYALGDDRRPRRFGIRSLSLEPVRERPAGPRAEGARLILPAGTSTSFFVRLPPDARVVADGGAGDAVGVSVESDHGRERTIRPRDLGERRVGFDLGAAAGTFARVTLAARGSTVTLVHPRLEGRVPVASSPPSADVHPAPNVILYVADTLRADRLGCLGYGRPTSPRLDAFAREAIVFERAVAEASWTRPATASILTGRYPVDHGAQSLMGAIRPDVPTLATILSDHGYDTAAFVTNLNVSARFGFGRGFAEYRYLEEREDRDIVYASAAELNAAAFPWLEARRDRPFFLYLHATDAHAPYRPPREYAARFVSPDLHATIDARTPLRRLLERPALATPENVAFMSGLYDGEVALLDDAFGALLARLVERGLDRSTVVIFVADHGEEFHEHGSFDHGRTLYEELVHVPLVIRLPAGADGGRRVGTMARQIDLVPTVLRLVGIPPPSGLPGRALLHGRDDEAPDEAVLETHLGHPGVAGVVSGRWKIVWGEGRLGVERPEVYDLQADPVEKRNVAGEHPVLIGYARQTMARLRRAGAAGETTVVDPETERRLRALGYVDPAAP